jgi:hypothetical protein
MASVFPTGSDNPATLALVSFIVKPQSGSVWEAPLGSTMITFDHNEKRVCVDFQWFMRGVIIIDHSRSRRAPSS